MTKFIKTHFGKFINIDFIAFARVVNSGSGDNVETPEKPWLVMFTLKSTLNQIKDIDPVIGGEPAGIVHLVFSERATEEEAVTTLDALFKDHLV